MTSPLGFKSRVGSALFALGGKAYVFTLSPFRFTSVSAYTCWPLGRPACSPWADLFHIDTVPGGTHNGRPRRSMSERSYRLSYRQLGDLLNFWNCSRSHWCHVFNTINWSSADTSSTVPNSLMNIQHGVTVFLESLDLCTAEMWRKYWNRHCNAFIHRYVFIFNKWKGPVIKILCVFWKFRACITNVEMIRPLALNWIRVMVTTISTQMCNCSWQNSST